jgi:polyribonucleotide nucleotidyltransferase
MKVALDKVKEVIGKWWDVINKIIDLCDWVKIDFDEDWTCFITHQDQAMIDKAVGMIKEIVTDLEIWQTFDAKITRVEDYGIFVQLAKNKIWLCHVSNLGQRFDDSLSKHFKIWEIMKVKITWIDWDGKIGVKRAL